jgi:hypothetical protein
MSCPAKRERKREEKKKCLCFTISEIHLAKRPRTTATAHDTTMNNNGKRMTTTEVKNHVPSACVDMLEQAPLN